MKTLIRVFDNYYNFMNVIVPLSMDFNEVIYIYHHKIDESQFNNCSEVLHKYKKDLKIKYKYIKDDEKEVTSLLNNNCVIDISITKYLSAFLFEKALNNNLEVVYFDSEECSIKNYKTHSTIIDKVFGLTIDDMVMLGGGKIINNSMHKHVDLYDIETVEAIVKAVERNIDRYSLFINFVQRINSYITNHEISKKKYFLSEDIKNKIINDEEYKKIKDCNLFKIEDNTLIFKSEFVRSLFSISGAFLENYLYIKLLSSHEFDQIYMSSIVDFSDNNNQSPIKCELDCLAIKDNHLLFISCKSNKVDTDDLNEIKIHDTIFGNDLSYPVICTMNDLSKDGPVEYLKAKQLGIKVIDKTSFVNDSIVKDILSILDNSYKYERV